MGAPITVETLNGLGGWEEVFGAVVGLANTAINAGVTIDQGNKAKDTAASQTAAQAQATAQAQAQAQQAASLASAQAQALAAANQGKGGSNTLLWVGGGVLVLGVITVLVLRRKK